jgi:hypothetical protein
VFPKSLTGILNAGTSRTEIGRAVAEAFSSRPLTMTMGALVQTQTTLCVFVADKISFG